jgi:hypothetical protein
LRLGIHAKQGCFHLGQEAAVDPASETMTGPVESRALVKVSRPARRETTHLPGAGFLAQLIACDQKLPQTRERRRAEPQEATAVYAQPLPIAVDPAGHTLSLLA